MDLLCAMCKRILEETKGCGVPLGVSVESVSIFKNEIDAAHELFRRTQSMLLDFLGEPWLVQYKIVEKGAKRTSFDYGAKGSPKPKTVAALPSTSEKGGGGGGGGGGGDEEKMKNAVVAVVSGVVGLLLGSVLKGGRGKKAEPAPAPAAKSRW